jgi:hypothetical protein
MYVCIKYRLMNELCPVVTHILLISKFVIEFVFFFFNLSKHFIEMKLYSTDKWWHYVTFIDLIS